MKVLVACEESQTVCKAFRELEHEAYKLCSTTKEAIEAWNRRAEAVKDQPAADVVVVRHGKWIQESFEFFKCSECGYLTDYRLSNFCPDCGAKMDGKVGADNA